MTSGGVLCCRSKYLGNVISSQERNIQLERDRDGIDGYTWMQSLQPPVRTVQPAMFTPSHPTPGR